jgi:hypothetical protein
LCSHIFIIHNDHTYITGDYTKLCLNIICNRSFFYFEMSALLYLFVCLYGNHLPWYIQGFQSGPVPGTFTRLRSCIVPAEITLHKDEKILGRKHIYLPHAQTAIYNSKVKLFLKQGISHQLGRDAVVRFSNISMIIMYYEYMTTHWQYFVRFFLSI